MRNEKSVKKYLFEKIPQETDLKENQFLTMKNVYYCFFHVVFFLLLFQPNIFASEVCDFMQEIEPTSKDVV